MNNCTHFWGFKIFQFVEAFYSCIPPNAIKDNCGDVLLTEILDMCKIH